jgi:adenylate cyclase
MSPGKGYESSFVGRDDVFNELKEMLEASREGNGQFALISGEAGIGKTKLVLELQKQASQMNFMCLKGSCIYNEISDPYLPFMTALSRISRPEIVEESQKYVMINEAFLIDESGKVISYASRLGANIMDEDIVGGMLSAVEAFVRDAFGDGESTSKRLDTLIYGPIHIYIEHGKSVFLAVVLSGAEPEGIRGDLKKMVNNIEKDYHDVISEWDGNVSKVSEINQIISKLTLVRYRIKRGIKNIDIKREKDRVFERVLQLIRKASKKEQIMLVLEDIHWADSSSLQLLSYIARNTKDCRVFICATYRPEELDSIDEHKMHPLKETILRMSRDKIFSSQELDRLTISDVQKLLHYKLDLADIPKEFINRIYTQTEGNPFFIEEVLRSFEDEGIIRLEDDRFVLDEIKEVNIPSTIKDLIELRTTRLDSFSLDTIRHAAVIGREFDFDILKRTTGLNQEKLISALESLKEKKLIIPKTKDEDEYQFSHSMIREVIYDNISGQRKRMMHEDTAYMLLRQYKDDIDPVIYELARHFSKTKEYKKAFEYSVKAGEKASVEFALNEAFEFYKLAFSAIDRMTQTLDTKVAKLMVATNLGDISYVIGEWDFGFKYYDIVKRISKELGDEKSEAEAYKGSGLLYVNKNEWEKAKDDLDISLKIFQSIQDQHGLADTYYNLGSVFEKKGEFTLAIENYGNCMHFAEDVKDTPEIARAHMGVGRVYAQKGEFEKSIESIRRAVQIIEKTGDMDELAKVYANLGATYNYLDLDEAVKYHNKVIGLTNKTGNIRLKGYALMNLSYSLILKKEKLDDIPNYLDSALHIFQKLDEKMAISATYTNFGIIYKIKKDWNESVDYFNKARAICNELKTPYNLGNVLYEYGLMYKEKGDCEQAKRRLNESLEIFKDMNNKKMIEKVEKEILDV